jgi:large subunit ribosomal protein L24
MSAKMDVKSGDMVEVLAGVDKGVRGRVLRALPQENKVVVEGVNVRWKHVQRSRENPRGGRTEMEMPVNVSNVSVLCQNRECDFFDRPVRTGKKVKDDGTKVRVCAKCGEEIAAPE